MDAPVSCTNTSSSEGLCRPTESTAPGNASTTSAMKRWPLAISTRTSPSRVDAVAPKRCRMPVASDFRVGSFENDHVAADGAKRNSAGLPWTTIFPWCSRIRRSQRSAFGQDVSGEAGW